MNIKFSRITALPKEAGREPDRLTKEMMIRNGELVSNSATNFSYGEIEHCEVDNLFQFNKIIQSLTQNQCLVYGIPDSPKAKIVSRGSRSREQRENPKQEIITRTLDDIRWGVNPGIWLGDYDPPNRHDALSMGGLRDRLISAMPELEFAPMLIRHSSSSWINRTSGEVEYGEGGKRFYTIIDTPAKIPFASQTLFDRCWLAGLGWVKISEDGRCLTRAVNDTAVCSPEHIDYAAMPVLGDGLVFAHQKHEFQVWCGGLLIESEEHLSDLRKEHNRISSRNKSRFAEVLKFRDIKPLTSAEMNDVRDAQKDLEKRHKDAAETQHQKWLAARADEIEERTRCSYSEAEKQAEQASKTEILPDSWLLYFTNINGSLAKAEKVSVAEIKADPDRWVGRELLDPIAPDYRDYKVVAKLFSTDKRLKIHSKAHGSRVYYLIDQNQNLTYKVSGEVHPLLLSLEEIAEYMTDGENGDGELLKRLISNRIMCISEGTECARWDGNKWFVSESGNKDYLADTLRSIYDPNFDTLIKMVDSGETRHARKRARDLKENSGKDALLKSYREKVSVSIKEFDNNHFLLPFTNGVYNLQEREFRPSLPSDLMTKQVAYPYDPDARCPRWLDFLNKIHLGEREVIDFIQTWWGFCLTGSAAEFFLFYFGGGQNGKSVSAEVPQRLLGSFSTTLDSKLFFGGLQNEQYEKMKLLGVRVATTSEFKDKVTFESSVVKSLVGGDQITGRNPTMRPVSFYPTHKLILTGNHEPKISDTSLGTRRRIIKIPFNYTIPDEEKKERETVIGHFLEEGSGILNWMIEGWERYCEQGRKFIVPKILRDATDAFIQEHTKLAPEVEFLEDMVSADRFLVEKDNRSIFYPTTLLCDAYNEWANKAGKPKLTQTAFTAALVKAGYKKDRLYYQKKQQTCFFGVAPIVDKPEKPQKDKQDSSGEDDDRELFQQIIDD